MFRLKKTTSWVSLVFLPLLCTLFPTSWAQQAPSIVVEKFDTSVSYRTNVCDRQFQVWKGEVDLPNALRGLNLTAVITNYREPDENKYFTLVDGKIKPNDPGLFAVILDEVAARAGFEWRNSFGVASPLSSIDDEGKSWTDILTWGVQTFDISMEKWGKNIGRMELGVSFPAGWWDSSIVLVEQSGGDEDTDDLDVYLWSFLDPFQWTVWLTIVATILVTGLLYWSLEYLDVEADERDLEDKPVSSMYYSALVFIGQLEFRPKTDAARIVTWSWTFWAVIVGSAYTANMASFLVSPQVETYKISTMEDAIAQNANICVQNGGVLSTILQSKYGELNLVPKDTEAGIFLGLYDGSCQVAAHQMNTFRIYEKNLETNPDCTLDSAKRVVQPVPAGMATAIDTGVEYCSSLISHVLDFHLTEMLADGFVERAWKTHLNKVATIECVPEPPRTASFGSDTFSLGMQDVGGIFILHGIVLGAALILSLFQFYYFNTSNQTLAEVFFVKQAAEGIARRRDSIRASIQRRASLQKGREPSDGQKPPQDQNNNTKEVSFRIPGMHQQDVPSLRMDPVEEGEDSTQGLIEDVTQELLAPPSTDSSIAESLSLREEEEVGEARIEDPKKDTSQPTPGNPKTLAQSEVKTIGSVNEEVSPAEDMNSGKKPETEDPSSKPPSDETA